MARNARRNGSAADKRHAHAKLEMHRAAIERSRSGAAGAHADRRTRRLRTRGAQRRSALADA